MARGDKTAYTDKQQRQAEHIEEGYERRGMPEERAEGIAWATVNKESGGGKKSGSGRASGKSTHKSSNSGSRTASSHATSSSRSAAAKKGWETRRRNAGSK
jgi:plasmid stabilization system protein ParE